MMLDATDRRIVELTQAGIRRRQTLDADARAVLRLVERILTEMGALKRTRHPDPKPAPEPGGDGERKQD